MDKPVSRFSIIDSREARCLGLIEQLALREADNAEVHATHVRKSDGPFYCPECLSEAVVRKCTEKKDHFAHKARHSPIAKGDMRMSLHNKCRDELCAMLTEKYPDGKWKAERPIPANEEKGYKEVVPDISGRIGETPIAIEVQLSPYTINRIATKTKQYHERGVAVLWIVPLTKELGDKPFRPRHFEKYLHSLYFGRVYYWTPESGKDLFAVHYSPTARWIESSSWFDTEQQEERTEGGYALPYKTLKKPLYGSACDLLSDFKSNNRKEFSPLNVKKSIPESTIYIDGQKKWWSKDEYQEARKLVEQARARMISNHRENYGYLDDYDDEFSEE